MKKVLNKKIISIFLLLIVLIAQLSSVFAVDSTTEETTKTLTQYLIENGVDSNGDGVLSDTEWAKVKNLYLLEENIIDITGIEKAINLKYLSLDGGGSDVSIDFSKLTKLEELSICNANLQTSDFSKLNNLESLDLSRCDGIENIDFSILKKLTFLDLSNCFDFKCLDISNLQNLEVISINYSQEMLKIKFPKFKNLEGLHLNCKGEILIDGLLDLTSCNLQEGWIEGKVDFNKIKLNDEMMAIGQDRITRLVPVMDLEIFKGDKYYLGDGCELIENENDKVAIYNDGYIESVNIGTTKMIFKDSLERKYSIEVKVKNLIHNNVDTTLETRGITAKFVGYLKVLRSNGELWDIYNEYGKLVDNNVKNYVENYDDYFGQPLVYYIMYAVSSTLKNDGTLKIKCEWAEKEIENVKQNTYNVYLTNDGKLYELGLNYIIEEITPKLIKENVKELINDCIVLEDGTTWYLVHNDELTTSGMKFKKLADFEIKDMSYYYYEGRIIPTVVDNDNNLWCCNSKNDYFDDSGLEILQKNFEGYKLDKRYGDGGTTSLKILENGDLVKENNEKVILSSVSQIYDEWSAYTSIIRTDGTIWTYSDEYGLTKITKSTTIDNGKAENYLNSASKLKETKIDENATVLTGISNDTTVQAFINQNNFNSMYQVKMFDANNNEISGESILGTGCIVRLYKNGDLVKEYVIVIYGDTTGDGSINAVDALTLIKAINNKVSFKSKVHKEAGNVYSKSGRNPTAVDALAIIKNANNKYTINQYK